MSISGAFNTGSLSNILNKKMRQGPINNNPSGCEFCTIGQTDPKSQIIHQDPKCFIVRDIRPAAMHHLLVIPQHHVANILESDVDTVKQLEKAAFDFLKSDPDAQRLKVIEKQDFDMGFHRPPFNSKHHLHLHVVYPVSKMSPSQKKRIRNPGFIHVHKWLGTEFKTDSNLDKARPCIICQLAKSGNTAKNRPASLIPSRLGNAATCSLMPSRLGKASQNGFLEREYEKWFEELDADPINYVPPTPTYNSNGPGPCQWGQNDSGQWTPTYGNNYGGTPFGGSTYGPCYGPSYRGHGRPKRYPPRFHHPYQNY